MPSPIGHTLAGLTVATLCGRGGGTRLLVPVLLAVAPDADILPGWLQGAPNAYHAEASHSLGAAAAVAAATGLGTRLYGGRFLPAFGCAAAAYTSHLLLDALGKEKKEGQGIPLLWPLSRRRFATARPWFRTIAAKRGSGNFLSRLMTRGNLRAVRREVALLLPPLLVAHYLSRSA